MLSNPPYYREFGTVDVTNMLDGSMLISDDRRCLPHHLLSEQESRRRISRRRGYGAAMAEVMALITVA